MVLSRDGKKNAIKHILENVFDKADGSFLHLAFDYNDIKSPHDIYTLTTDEINALQYKDANDTILNFPVANRSLIKAFKAFIQKKTSDGTPIEDNQWVIITRQEFDDFRISPEFSIHTSAPTPTSLATPTTNSSNTPLREFKRGIKRDISQFTPLKDDSAWDNWNCGTLAQARAQDVDDILNSTYTPNTVEEKELFDEKQKYMYAVFEKNLLTDKGKALVRQYQVKYDAQRIYKELKDYANKSTKASMDASGILTYITSVKLGDGKWKGTTHAFILHWNDQVRKYHDPSDGHNINSKVQQTLLENAVQPIAELCVVKDQADQYKSHTGK